MAATRDFQLVLLGPTGYTGKLCAQHIVKNFPTNFKWALAGRSLPKVQKVADELKKLNPDRQAPELLEVQLTKVDLTELAQKTRLIINTVGPYHLYSTPVVEACARNGTHYVDVTGETPWIKQIISQFHDIAKSNDAIIIPSVGVESAPADMLTWSLVKRLRQEFSCDTRTVTCAINEMKSSGASGGTLNTILTILDSMNPQDLLKQMQPFSLAATTPPRDIPRKPLTEHLLGVRQVRDMGVLTSSPSGIADITLVHRSSTSMPELYGKRFYFQQYLRVRNVFVAIAFHLAFHVVLGLLLFAPVRALLRKVIYMPGQGPSMEASTNDRVEYRAVATPDEFPPSPRRVLGQMKYEGGMYVLTGVLVAEAAKTILDNEDKVRKVSRCGIVTPATLGQEYVDGLEKRGVQFNLEVLDY